jgi:hypothetical protein
MVGGTDHVTVVPLDVAAAEGDPLRFDVELELQEGAMLRDVEIIGGRVRVFYAIPNSRSRYRLSLWEPPTADDIDLEVTWRLPIWRTVGDVSVSFEVAADDG